MTTQHEERRRFSRILYAANAELSSGETSIQCQITDLSLKGCLLKLPENWVGAQSKKHKLMVNLSDECQIEMELTLTYLNGREGGFYCDKIDIDSISELRRLIELNLGDSQLLERELDHLAHIN